jgi:hypothetical protein
MITPPHAHAIVSLATGVILQHCTRVSGLLFTEGA